MSDKNRIANWLAALGGDDGSAVALATVIHSVSPTSGEVGDKALVTADRIVEGWIGGSCSQTAVVRAAGDVLSTGEAKVIRVGPKNAYQEQEGIVDFTSGCLSGGTLVIFVEPVLRRPHLLVLGNSPIATQLCVFAQQAEFSVTAVSPDFNSKNTPQGLQISQAYSDLEGDYVVVATQGRRDQAALQAAAESGAAYISMVASRKKFAGLKERLQQSGVSVDVLEEMRNPAGLDIGAVTPQEIAISIVADLIRFRRTSSSSKSQQADEFDNVAGLHDKAVAGHD